MESFRVVPSGFPKVDPDAIEDVESLLGELGKLVSDTRTIVVINEFFNLADVYPEASALLQMFIDHKLEGLDFFLILSGLLIGSMGTHLNLSLSVDIYTHTHIRACV